MRYLHWPFVWNMGGEEDCAGTVAGNVTKDSPPQEVGRGEVATILRCLHVEGLSEQ